MVLKQLEVQQTNKILQEQQQNYTHLDTKFQLPPNSKWITEEIKEEIKKFLQTNDNENTMTHNLWDAAKAVLRGKFIIQSYLKKEETSQIKNLAVHLKQLEKEEQKTLQT